METTTRDLRIRVQLNADKKLVMNRIINTTLSYQSVNCNLGPYDDSGDLIQMSMHGNGENIKKIVDDLKYHLFGCEFIGEEEEKI